MLGETIGKDKFLINVDSQRHN